MAPSFRLRNNAIDPFWLSAGWFCGVAILILHLSTVIMPADKARDWFQYYALAGWVMLYAAGLWRMPENHKWDVITFYAKALASFYAVIAASLFLLPHTNIVLLLPAWIFIAALHYRTLFPLSAPRIISFLALLWLCSVSFSAFTWLTQGYSNITAWLLVLAGIYAVFAISQTNRKAAWPWLAAGHVLAFYCFLAFFLNVNVALRQPGGIL